MTLTVTFAPVRREETLVLERQGDTLIANGVVHDLAALAADAGDTPGEGWVVSVTAVKDGYAALVLLPHGADAPEAVRFPQPVIVTEDGTVTLPGSKPARRRRRTL